MNEQEVAAQVRANQPPGARAYYLWNYGGRYPTSGAFSCEPMTQPFGLPPGEYRIAFLSEVTSQHPLPARNPSNPNPTIKVGFTASQELAPAPAAPSHVTGAEKAARSPAKEPDPIENDPDHVRNRVEFEAIRMADQTVRNKHLIAGRLEHTREVGEMFVYSRAHRQEMEQMLRVVGETSRSTLAFAQRTLAQAEEMAQHVYDTRKNAPADSGSGMTGIIGQLLGLVTAAIGGSRKGGDEPLDAILEGSSDDSEKLAAVKKTVAKLKRRLREAEKKQPKEDKPTAKGSKGKKGATKREKARKSDARPRKKTPSQTKAARPAKKTSTRKALPAKGSRS